MSADFKPSHWSAAGAAIVATIGYLSTPMAAGAKELTMWQEMVVQTVSKLETAASTCGFKLNENKVGTMLYSADLSRDSLHAIARSHALQERIDSDAVPFRSNREAACRAAWDSFGADAVPGARDLLMR